MSSATIPLQPNTYQKSTYNRLIQSIDNQCLPWIASISTISGVVAPFFKSLQNVFSVDLIPSFLFKRTPFFIVAGISLTIMFLSRLSRLDDIRSIDQTEELLITDILMNSGHSEQTKRGLAEKIVANPGNYSPFILVYAGIYFLKEKDYKKAATLCVGGVCRSEIDVKISQDTTISVTGVAVMRIDEAIEEFLKTDSEFESWNKARKTAYKKFVEWDQRTPRNYDDRWVRLNSMGVFTETGIAFIEIRDREKKRLIDTYYKEHAIAVTKLD
jgi:hypothetical protein